MNTAPVPTPSGRLLASDVLRAQAGTWLGSADLGAGLEPGWEESMADGLVHVDHKDIRYRASV